MQLHIGYLRSLGDTERARTACLTYLQTGLIFYYPGRPDIVREFYKVAEELGGKLAVPRLSWKYSWMKAVFGWGLAKRTQLLLANARWSLIRSWDKAMFRLKIP
jgi:hypothetical protein